MVDLSIERINVNHHKMPQKSWMYTLPSDRLALPLCMGKLTVGAVLKHNKQCLEMEGTKSNTSWNVCQFLQCAPHRMDGSIYFEFCPFLSDKDLDRSFVAESDSVQR